MKRWQKSFSFELRAVLEAVSDRMVPEDAWPSATKAGVLTYLECHIHEDPGTWMNFLEPGLLAAK